MTSVESGASPLRTMAGRIAAFDWASSPLGPRSQWAIELQTALSLCLGSRMCSCIYWGKDHNVLYNDAYGSILGTKHPWALGRTAKQVWPEIFDVIGPLLARTWTTGETTGGDDVAIFLNRSGYVEEFYCSFSYSPLVDSRGDIQAIFAILPETSIRVIGERRLRTLQRLGADAREARQVEQTLRIAADVLGHNPCDIPFSALYLCRNDAEFAELCATSNLRPGGALCPTQFALNSDSVLGLAVREASANGYAIIAAQPEHHPLPCGAWTIPPREVIVMALAAYGENAASAILLAGVSPHKRLDADHLAFFHMLGDQLKRSLSESLSHEQEDDRIRELQQRAQKAQETERVRIARDLHDTLLQSIQGMRFLLEAGLSQVKSGDESAVDLFESALQASQHAIEEGRQVLSLLRSTALSAHGVEGSLAALRSELLTNADSEIAIDVRGKPRQLKPAFWNEAYGICREAVNNAIQHAKASHIKVSLCANALTCRLGCRATSVRSASSLNCGGHGVSDLAGLGSTDRSSVCRELIVGQVWVNSGGIKRIVTTRTA